MCAEDVLWPWHSVAQHARDSQAAPASLLSRGAAELSPAVPAGPDGVAAQVGQAAVKQEVPPSAAALAAEEGAAPGSSAGTAADAADARSAGAAAGAGAAPPQAQAPAPGPDGALRSWFDSVWQVAAADKDLRRDVQRSWLVKQSLKQQQQQQQQGLAGQLAAGGAGLPPPPQHIHPPPAPLGLPACGAAGDAVDPRAWLEKAGQEAARMVAAWQQQQQRRQPVKRVWGAPPPPCLATAVRGKLMHNAAGIRQALNQVLDAALGAVIQRRQQQPQQQRGRGGGEPQSGAGRQRGSWQH